MKPLRTLLALLIIFAVAIPAIAEDKPDDIIIINVTVNTTEDDKDNDCWWVVEVADEEKVYGKTEIGKNEIWKNHSTKTFRVALTTAIPLAHRQLCEIKITQNSASKNWGWEGVIQVRGGQRNRGQLVLLKDTQPFKLGENNNAKTVEFAFN